MVTSKFQRARSSQHKEVRRQQLLVAAAALFDAEPWEAITVAGVAQRAGLAKGTTYRYFATKEALFLDLLLQELAGWSDALRQEHGRTGKREVAWAFARTLTTRPRLVRLLGLLHAVLDVNVTPDAALAFRRATFEIDAPLAAWVERAAGLGPAEGFRFLLRANALIVGLGQMARPSAAVEAAFAADPSLNVLRVNFASELEQSLVALLQA